jgi:hypothetical protein
MAEQDAGSDKVDEATREVDEHDAHAKAHPDRMPTPEEERLAEQNELDPEVAESYKEAAERGANVKGEGSIEL